MNIYRAVLLTAATIVLILTVQGCATDAGTDIIQSDLPAVDAFDAVNPDIFDISIGNDNDIPDNMNDGDHSRDSADGDDTSDTTGTDTDNGSSSDLPDADDPCSHCPNSICDPESGACLECTNDFHCGLEGWCDNGSCRANLCSPGALFCNDTVLFRCSENGGGFTIIEDCDDNNLCTEGDGCENGKCVTGTPKDCSDDNECTIDYCMADGSCDHYAAEDIACDDKNPCTENDMCRQGSCIPGNPINCDDKNPCTIDYCTQRTGCIHEPVTGTCADSNGCTENDRCIQGRCSGDVTDCDDGNPCTDDYCASNECAHESIAGCQPCRDDSDCPIPGLCETVSCNLESGECVFEIKRTDGCCLLPSDCGETAPCERVMCDPAHRCITGALDQAGCCENDVMHEDFAEGVPPGWELENENFESGWRSGTLTTPVDGITPPALYFGNSDETSYFAGVSVSGLVRSKTVTLPAGSAIVLEFDTWQDVSPVGGFDVFEVYVTSQTSVGKTRDLLYSRPADFPMQETESISIDISGFSGRTVRFEFVFDTIDEIDNDGRGVYLDNIKVQASCKRLACISDYHCKSAGNNGFCFDGRCGFERSWVQISAFGEPGNGTGQFSNATDLVVVPGPENEGNQIVVSDNRTRYIMVFEPDGEFVRTFGGYGVTDSRFLTPRGMSYSDGRIFIADSGSGRIQAMTVAGVFLYSFGSVGTGPGQFDSPRGVATSPDGERIFVADTGNHRISVFSMLGVYLFSFGAWGTSDGRFRTPSDLTVTQNGDVWVADTQNNRIQVFSSDGILKNIIDDSVPGGLSYPGGIAGLPDGGVVVADTYNHRLVLLDSDGNTVNTFGSFGTGDREFNYPSDVDILNDAGGIRLVISDSGNYRVTQWAVKMW